MIPIKGYATFDTLKHCVIGRHFSSDFFDKNIKNKKISDPLRRIADETEQDYQKLDDILKKAGVQTYRVNFNEENYHGNYHGRPPVCPRDHFAVIGEKFYAFQKTNFYDNLLKNISRENLRLGNKPDLKINTANICRVGKDLFWDTPSNNQNDINSITNEWIDKGFRVHVSHRGYHTDGSFTVVKPGCIVSLTDIQNYKTDFPGWDVLYLPDQTWDGIQPFRDIREKVGGRWWVKGEENNNELIHFINTWLNDWVGFVEETVFDINMLSIDQNTIICNNYNKEVFDHFRKHKVEPIIFNFRHRYFWDGGVHCITQDLYREGTQEDYFG